MRQVATSKGNRVRFVPLTPRLAAALKRYRHMRSPRVLCGTSCGTRSARVAGATAESIQQLVGHRDLATTQGYIYHLSLNAVFYATDCWKSGIQPQSVETLWRRRV